MLDFGEDRRLSKRRLILAICVSGLFVSIGSWFATKAAIDIYTHAWRGGSTTWVAPYVNVELKPTVFFEGYDNPLLQNIVMGPVVAETSERCSPSWGARYNLEAAARALDLDRRLVRFRARGGTAIASFAGDAESDLATACTDVESLTAAYQTVIDRYQLGIIDFLVRQEVLSGQSREVNQRRLAAIERLASANQDLEIWLSLPATSKGLTPDAIKMTVQLLQAGVKPAGINVMTMNFGASKSPKLPLLDTITTSLTNASRQLVRVYREADAPIKESAIWQAMGITPMIGQNEFAAEVLTPEDAADLLDFLDSKDLGRISLWSINRDLPCGRNIETKQVMDTCSGVDQDSLEFSRLFTKRFPISAMGTAGSKETAKGLPEEGGILAKTASVTKNRERTPYPLWLQKKVYDETEKVSWQGRVYQAKWWTQGEQPDAPFKHAWESPWRYLGPVLPSDQKAINEESLAASGDRIQWTLEKVFLARDEVIYEDKVFRSKWWTQGQQPESLPESSYDHPWEYLGSTSCEDDSCIQSGIGAGLIVDYGGLTDVRLEIRDDDGSPGVAGRLIRSHNNQAGQKTYQVLRDSYDLLFSTATAEYIIDGIDCRKGNCDASGIAATLSVDFAGLSDVAMEIRENDETTGTTGNLVQIHTNQNGQKSYKVLKGSYDIIFNKGPSKLLLDAVDCTNISCTTGDIVSTLFVDYKRLADINLEIHVDDGLQGTAGNVVEISLNQTGQKTYKVLKNSYDLIFKMSSSEFIVDKVDCRTANCTAGKIAATLSVDYGSLSGVEMEIREADGRIGTAGALLGSRVDQSGHKTYDVLQSRYDLVFKKGAAELVVDTVSCRTGACRVRQIYAELLIEYGWIPTSIEVRAKDGYAGTTGGLVESHQGQTGSQRYHVLRGHYDVAVKDDEWSFIKDAIDCSTKSCELRLEDRERSRRLSSELQAAALRAQISFLMERYTEYHPSVIAARRRLAELRAPD
jgi:chitinase